MTTRDDDVVLVYMGGAHIHGVPARDIRRDELDRYRGQIEANYRATGRVLYAPVAESDPAVDLPDWDEQELEDNA